MLNLGLLFWQKHDENDILKRSYLNLSYLPSTKGFINHEMPTYDVIIMHMLKVWTKHPKQ